MILWQPCPKGSLSCQVSRALAWGLLPAHLGTSERPNWGPLRSDRSIWTTTSSQQPQPLPASNGASSLGLLLTLPGPTALCP